MGKRNDTPIVVDFLPINEMLKKADAEVEAQHGQDLFAGSWSMNRYEAHTIDHREIYEECERRFEFSS